MAQTAYSQDDVLEFKAGATRKLAEHAVALKYEACRRQSSISRSDAY